MEFNSGRADSKQALVTALSRVFCCGTVRGFQIVAAFGEVPSIFDHTSSATKSVIIINTVVYSSYFKIPFTFVMNL